MGFIGGAKGFHPSKGSAARVAGMTALMLTIILASFAAGFIASWNLSVSSASGADDFAVYWEAWRVIKSEFYDELPSPREMTYASIKGMLRSLEDPYSVFVEPSQNELEKATYEGSFGGIGALIQMEEDGRLVITSVLPKTPAAKAGLKAGDVILEVDGNRIAPGLSQAEAVALVRGPVGSEVRLLVLPEGLKEPRLLVLIREKIQTPTVAWKALNQQVGYIAISMLGERTNDELIIALKELKGQGIKAIILDLRDNPGGLVDSAIQVTSQFLGEGTILYQRDSDGKEQAFDARGGGLAFDLPLAVLVNGGTASSAEIIAGALRDHGCAVLIGQKTWGKGSVQNIHELGDGSGLHITAARWFTPLHHQLEGQGLEPDIEVELSEEDRQAGRDPQLEEGLKYVEKDI